MYHKSPKRLRDLQSLAEDLDETVVKPQKAHGTRWLQHKKNAIKALLRSYLVIVHHLEERADSAGFKAYLKQLTSFKFVSHVLLFDIIPTLLAALYLNLQCSFADLQFTISSLKAAGGGGECTNLLGAAPPWYPVLVQLFEQKSQAKWSQRTLKELQKSACKSCHQLATYMHPKRKYILRRSKAPTGVTGKARKRAVERVLAMRLALCMHGAIRAPLRIRVISCCHGHSMKRTMRMRPTKSNMAYACRPARAHPHKLTRRLYTTQICVRRRTKSKFYLLLLGRTGGGLENDVGDSATRPFTASAHDSCTMQGQHTLPQSRDARIQGSVTSRNRTLSRR